MSLPPSYSLLPWRGVLAITGPDRATFLQGLLTNDIGKAADGLWAALLSPQGKVLHEFFVLETGDALLIDAEAERLDDLASRLKKYKLRAQVALTPRPDLAVAQIFNGEIAAPDAARCHPFADPRHAKAGLRVIVPAEEAETILSAVATAVEPDVWNLYRRRLGLPDGAADTGIEASFALEIGMHDLNGVDFQKGCYVGQETTARMKYRSLLKKRLTPVEIVGLIPPAGAPLVTVDGVEVGTFRSATNHNGETIGLAVLKLDYLDKGPFTAAAAVMQVVR